MNSALTWAVRGIDALFHEPNSSLMKGLVYGVPIQLDPQFKQDITRSGLAHLVVISGANVTLLTDLSDKLFFSISKKWGVVFQCLFLCCFVALVGPQAPLIRAVSMFFCTVVCILTGRPSRMGWNLFLTVLAVAIVYPKWISSLSFQLSVAATIGIIIWGFLSKLVKKKIHPLFCVFLESWVVFVVTLPLAVFNFKSFSIMSPLSTALVSWLIVPLMIAGFCISFLYLFFPQGALLIAMPTQMGLQYIIFIITTISHLPFGYISLL